MSEAATGACTIPPPAGGSRRRVWRAVKLIFATALIAFVGAAIAAWWWIASLGPTSLGEGLSFSTLVVDRDGKLLRPYATREGRWRLPAMRDNVDPRFLDMLLAYEDSRFPHHHGVDPLALGRAFSQLMRKRHVVSGASTL